MGGPREPPTVAAERACLSLEELAAAAEQGIGRVRGEPERCFAEVAGLRERDDPYEAAMGHLNQAALAVARGDRQGAAELLGHMQATLEGAGIVLDPHVAASTAGALSSGAS